MELKERIRRLADLENVPKSKILWREVDAFLHEHAGHVGYELVTGKYDDREGIDYIRLRCLGSTDGDCLHHSSIVPTEYSIIYCYDQEDMGLFLQKHIRKAERCRR